MTDFFAPGTTYFHRRDGYTPPEEWRYFHCVAVSSAPGSGAPVAFGFIKSGSPLSGWTPAARGASEWAWGWVVMDDTPPASTL
ncbi:hypothetical protein ABT354_26515 [Streptomyces sp. NPDC000594]|uniref:hypothetical protein n=1 Tax=Streptomyces sp. NPDC000594 TaxID=3154261 RepID=UPI003318AAE3